MITYPLNNIEYEAADAELFHCTRTSGVWAKDDFPFSVTGADNSITIGTGIAWINNDKFSGKVVANKETTVLDLGVPDSVYPRIDVVAIQFNANANETKLVVKKGTPASSPLIPAISKTASLYELYLCKIERPAGEAVVGASSVSDLRLDPQYCGLMADSVTSVDTEQINRQIDEFIEKLRDTIDDVQAGAGVMLENYWSEDGKIPVRRGGTGVGTLDNDSFLVGNGENPVKLLTPSEVRNSLALGDDINSAIPVSSGGTGRTSLTANYFVRGNGTSAVKLSTPSQAMLDLGAQYKIHSATVSADEYGDLIGNYIDLNNEDAYTYIPASDRIVKKGRLNSSYGYGIVLSKSGTSNYLISAHATIQLNANYNTSGIIATLEIVSVNHENSREKILATAKIFRDRDSVVKDTLSIPLFLASITNENSLYLRLDGLSTSEISGLRIVNSKLTAIWID